MEVVIWKVVLPRGREVNGTAVGETKPIVFDYRLVTVESSGYFKTPYSERSKDPRSSRRTLSSAIRDFLTFCNSPIPSVIFITA